MKSISQINLVFKFSTLVCLLVFFCAACGKRSMFSEDPKLQKYKDRTRAYLPDLEPGILKAQLAYVNRDLLPDLVLLRTGDRGKPVLGVCKNIAG